jgi:limonene-1,2-epoxide hydrolase
MSTSQPLETVNRFLEATNHRKDIRAAVGFLTDDVLFVGPLMRTTGSAEYAALLERFLPAHVEMRVLRQFSEGEEVCSINELVVRSHAGSLITIAMAEWFKIRNGVIAEHRVFYDPREFGSAFGIC